MWSRPVEGSPRLTFDFHFTANALLTLAPFEGEVMVSSGDPPPVPVPGDEDPQDARSMMLAVAVARTSILTDPVMVSSRGGVESSTRSLRGADSPPGEPPYRGSRCSDVALSDETLLAAMAHGDQGAASALVRRYQARVYGLALTIVGASADAEEVSQEAFLKAWRRAETFDPRRGPVAAWLLTITRNAAVDAVRYRHEAPMDSDLLLAMLAQAGSSHESDRDTALMLRRSLAALPPDLRRPLIMMAIQGLTAREVAGRTGTPLGTVKTRVRRGLRRLRDELGVRDD